MQKGGFCQVCAVVCAVVCLWVLMVRKSLEFAEAFQCGWQSPWGAVAAEGGFSGLLSLCVVGLLPVQLLALKITQSMARLFGPR